MKPVKTTRTIEETKGWMATDGTFFEDIEECKKYEKTCKGVIMGAYKQLVKGYVTEYGLFETGSEEYGYDIIEIKSAQDLETINKAFEFYGANKILGNEYIGKTIMTNKEWNGELYGYVVTLDEFISNVEKNIRASYKWALENYEN